MPEWSEDLRRRVGAWAAERRALPALVARWQALPPDGAAALADLAEALRLGENHLRDILEWSEEVALRDGTSVAAVLGDEAMRAALAADRGRNEAIRAVRDILRRRRFPRLAAMEERLSACVRALRLPAAARVVLPPDLRDTELRLEIRAGDAEALRRAVETVGEALRRREVDEIYALLNGGGVDGVDERV